MAGKEAEVEEGVYGAPGEGPEGESPHPGQEEGQEVGQEEG
jgi:hypothetical protein